MTTRRNPDRLANIAGIVALLTIAALVLLAIAGRADATPTPAGGAGREWRGAPGSAAPKTHSAPSPPVASGPSHRALRVHFHRGQWAYTQPKPPNPRHIIAPRGNAAARKILAGRPGDIYRLTGAVHGRYRVVGVIDIGVTASAQRFWDERLHVHNTSRFVYTKEIRR